MRPKIKEQLKGARHAVFITTSLVTAICTQLSFLNKMRDLAVTKGVTNLKQKQKNK